MDDNTCNELIECIKSLCITLDKISEAVGKTFCDKCIYEPNCFGPFKEECRMNYYYRCKGKNKGE